MDSLSSTVQQKYKDSLILTQTVLMISFLQLLKQEWRKDHIFYQKLMRSIFSNFVSLFKQISKNNKGKEEWPLLQDSLKKFLQSANLGPSEQIVKVKENNKKMQRFILAQKNNIDGQTFNCLQKLSEFLEDFSLQESQSYLLETFRDPYKEQGVTQENQKLQEQQVPQDLVIISENSSERSSSVNSEQPKKNYTLVLDLDETLVHYSDENGEGKVYFRPHLDYFLKEMVKYFELMIFTAAQQDYADTVINIIDP